MAEQYPTLQDRPVKETICLFDVDGTLTPARQRVSPEMLELLSQLRHKCAIGFVGHLLSLSVFQVQQSGALEAMSK
jgi:phosphomannomutase